MEKTKTKKVMPKQEVKKVTEAKKPTGMSKEKKSIIAGLALIVAAAGISAGTYAFYQSTIKGTASGTIVAWECKAGGGASTFTLDLGNLKPNITKTIPINLSVKNFKAKFDIKLSGATNLSSDINFYTADTNQSAANCLSKTGTATDTCKLASTSTTLDATTSGTATGTVNLYMVWPKGQPEKGPSAASTAKITVNVTCTQQNQKPYGA